MLCLHFSPRSDGAVVRFVVTWMCSTVLFIDLDILKHALCLPSLPYPSNLPCQSASTAQHLAQLTPYRVSKRKTIHTHVCTTVLALPVRPSVRAAPHTHNQTAPSDASAVGCAERPDEVDVCSAQPSKAGG